MPLGFKSRKDERFEPTRDDLIHERMLTVMSLCKTFTLDIAELLHGHRIGEQVRRAGEPYTLTFDYLDPDARKALLDSVPFLDQGWRSKVDFGASTDVEIDRLERGGMVVAEFDLHSRSVAVDPYGRRFPAEDEWWRIRLFLDRDLKQILTVSMQPISAGGAAATG
ncbi:MAG: hypothetical protein ACYDGR_11275 [Candidatus Dormibacteria bacterium]